MEAIDASEPRALTKYARLVSKDGPFEADIVLYAADTPNSWKVATLLEELEVKYDVVPVNIAKDEQKEPWFMAMNPNGRTPAMLDRSNPSEPFYLFESGAMLLYLCDKYGSKLLPKTARGRSEVEQWLMWQMSALGPMLGNCMYFKRIAAPMADDVSRLQFGIDRYHRESERLLRVLEARLGERDFLCGPGRGEFSIADIACHGYAHMHWWAGVDISSMAGLGAWLARVAARPSSSAGFLVPAGHTSFMADDTTASAAKRARLEDNAKAAGRPFFGWRDLMETGPAAGQAPSGALAPPAAAAAAAAAAPAAVKVVKCQVLKYTYVEDVLERRGPYRAAHLAHATSYEKRGMLLLGGALDPPDFAYLIFKTDSQEEVEAFVKADPYVINGIVTAHEIRAWNVVAGSAL